MDTAINELKALEYPQSRYIYDQSVEQIFTQIRAPSKSGFQPIPEQYACATRVRMPVQCLGFILLDSVEMNIATRFTSRYAELERVRARRSDEEKSAFEIWHTDSQRDGIIARAIENMRGDAKKYARGNLLFDLIEQCNYLMDHINIPAYFPSILVSIVCQRILTKSTSNPIKMLDISAGWGDRLIAALALGYSYTGCDPNSRLGPVYSHIIQDLAHMAPKDAQYRVHSTPFEDWHPAPEETQSYDVLFSSPPFFDYEVYSDEPTQSIRRYTRIETWINTFMMPSLEKAHTLLKPGAYIVLHLQDIITAKQTIAFTEIILHYCLNHLHWKLMGKYIYTHHNPKKQEAIDERPFCNGFRTNTTGHIRVQILWVMQKT